jgi:RNA polymerase sigma-70 factor (ECF subfamily)
VTPEQAFDEHHHSVYRFVYRLAGRADLAEDITQDCFLAFIRDPHRYNAERAGIRTYLFSIARNLACKRYRDDHSAAHVDQDRAASLPDRRMDHELAAVVAQMVAQLPELQREALILFEYEGFALSEITQIVNADIGVVKSRLHRARQSLKRLLAPYKKVGTHGHV